MSSDQLFIYISANHEVQRFSIKILSFIYPYSEGAKSKRDVLRVRDTSGLDYCQFRMVAWQTNFLPWAFEFLISKKSLLISLTWGEKNAIKCHSRHKQKWNLNVSTIQNKVPHQGGAPATCLLRNITCLLWLDHSDLYDKGKISFPFCLGQDPGYGHSKLCIWLTTSSFSLSERQWVPGWEGKWEKAFSTRTV